MRVAVTGASGLIGRALVQDLVASGHRVQRLVRRSPQGPDEVRWDPKGGSVGSGLEGVQAVVHLAGAGVGDRRWTSAYKQEIRDSRVLGTQTLVRALADLEDGPDVLVSGSAIGYYGDRGADMLTEDSPAGGGFLAEVVMDWESAAAPAAEAGIRVAFARTGLVVSREGGLLARLLPIFRAGLGGRISNGQQYWSYISLRDEVAAIRHLIDRSELSGPVNLTTPNPITNREATAELGRFVGRPARLPVPGFALRAALGEFATEVVGGQRVLPERLERSGFKWRDPTLAEVLANA